MKKSPEKPVVKYRVRSKMVPDKFLHTFRARTKYIDNSCRNTWSCKIFHSNALLPLVHQGAQALDTRPQRFVHFNNKVILIDYRTLELYDEELIAASDERLWFGLSEIMKDLVDPKRDIIPHKIRRYLYSTNADLQRRLFRIFMQMSSKWVKGKVNGFTNATGSSNQRGHMFLVPG